MNKWNWTCLLLLIAAFLMFQKNDETIQRHGTILGKTHDHVKVGKNGFGDRFRVAVQYADKTAATIEVPYHYYLTAKVGQPIEHSVRTVTSRMEFVYIFGGSVCFSLGILFGFIPLLWWLYTKIKNF